MTTLVGAIDRSQKPLTQAPSAERFISLVDQNKKILYKVAATYTRDPADREDVAQEIVAQLWRSFPGFDERYLFSTWMYRVALNVAISFYRKETARLRRVITAEDALLEVANLAAEPVEADDGVTLLNQLIEQLDALDRGLILLYLEGNGYATIAEILGISETNVGTKLSRIKQRLRRDLAADSK